MIQVFQDRCIPDLLGTTLTHSIRSVWIEYLYPIFLSIVRVRSIYDMHDLDAVTGWEP